MAPPPATEDERELLLGWLQFLRGADRAVVTDEKLRANSLNTPCHHPGHRGLDLRWVLLHLIEETARHAGHADAARELLDSTTGV